MEKLKSTKFIACMVAVLGLLGAAFFGKFSGDLGLYVSGVVVAFITGNAFITGKALANGKGHDDPS